MNILTNYIEYGRKYFVAAEPMAMIYFVTKTCNCTCVHCFYWESLNKPRAKELTVEELDTITDSLGKLLYLRLSGGEPFIRKDLFEITHLFATKCRPSFIGIPTNGFFTDRIVQFAERAAFLDTRLDIGISIDDLGQHHNRIRGCENLFNIAVETFHQLKKTKSKAPNLRIGFVTTAMKSNQVRLFKLFDYLKNLDPDAITCNLIRDDIRVKEEKETDSGICQQFSDLCDDYNNTKLEQQFTLFDRLRQTKTEYAHEIRRETIKTNQFQIPCVAGDKIVVMYDEGGVYPCETLKCMIGNIRDYDYDMKKLLRSDQAKEVRKRIIKDQCFCTHECFITANILFSKPQMAKVLTRSLVKR